MHYIIIGGYGTKCLHTEIHVRAFLRPFSLALHISRIICPLKNFKLTKWSVPYFRGLHFLFPTQPVPVCVFLCFYGIRNVHEEEHKNNIGIKLMKEIGQNCIGS